MAAGDRVQIGKAFKVEYGVFAYTGYQPTSISNTRTADVESIKDIRNANISHQITNPGKQISITCLIEDSAGSITPPDIGDIITLTPPEGTSTKYCLLTAPGVTHGNGITTLTLTLTREDSMAAYYDA
jgi:hypothetical protein